MSRTLIIAALASVALAGCASPYGPVTVPLSPPQPIVMPPPPAKTEPGCATPTNPPELGAAGVLPPPLVAGPTGPVVIAPTASQPIVIPPVNRDVAWDQIVDVVDDYFEIDQEDRVKLVGDVLTEGRIDTFPVTGATIFEPWRRDSVNLYERTESTLQSIRRRAFVRVIPDAHGYVVDVTVIKELEDVPRPIMASAGGATFRYDTSLERDRSFAPDPFRIPGDPARPVGPRPGSVGWIPLGRDVALEQQMLAQIQGRIGAVAMQASAPVPFIGPTTLGPEAMPAGPAVYPPSAVAH